MTVSGSWQTARIYSSYISEAPSKLTCEYRFQWWKWQHDPLTSNE